MSDRFSPYDADRPLMLKCSCGGDHAQSDHHPAMNADAVKTVPVVSGSRGSTAAPDATWTRNTGIQPKYVASQRGRPSP